MLVLLRKWRERSGKEKERGREGRKEKRKRELKGRAKATYL